MGLRMKNFNIIGFHWKIRFLGGGGIHEKPIYRDEFSKKEGLQLFADLSRELEFLSGDWYPNAHYEMHIFFNSITNLISNIISV